MYYNNYTYTNYSKYSNNNQSSTYLKSTDNFAYFLSLSSYLQHKKYTDIFSKISENQEAYCQYALKIPQKESQKVVRKLVIEVIF